jgi:3-oxoacyl-[acyl-carrier-protein] synthase-3
MSKAEMPFPSVLITGSGSYLPEKVLTNHDLAKMMDTDDEWIRQRTGISQRHIVGDDELTSDMAVHAAHRALEMAGLTASDMDGIIVATTTPDDTFPSTAATVQRKLGASQAFAFDVQAVCAGFIYALDVADAMIKSGKAKKIVVIGAEAFSRILDWNDRSTAVLFGDGAGAVILEASDQAKGWGILSSVIFTDGRFRDILYVDGGPARGKVGTVKMNGQDVFKHAVEKLASGLDQAIKQSGLQENDIDWLVPHQANVRIINYLQKKLKMPDEKVVRTVSRHANTSAASIPLAFDEAMRENRIQNGDVVAFEGIGGGLAWGASIVRIGKPA